MFTSNFFFGNKQYLSLTWGVIIRVAFYSQPGRLIDSKIVDELKILVIILCQDHTVVVD